MHDEQMLDGVASRIRESGPPEPGAETVDAVLAAAKADAARAAERPALARWTARLPKRPVLAVAVIGVVLGLASVALYRAQPISAFAKEDALAALRPPAGQVIHAVTRSYAVNPGEVAPPEGAMSRDESWVDAAGNRSRSRSTNASTGAVLLDVLGADGRFRAAGDGLAEPVDSGVVITSAYMNGSVLGMALGDYEYIRGALPEGTVVGEVTQAGERYWDVRWNNVKDAYGLTLSARALFRITDYRPALLERSYEGGATTHWEVLEWQVIPESELATSVFDPASIGKPGMLEVNVWYPKDLASNVGYPVYWVGPKLGTRSVQMSSDGSPSGSNNPMFFERLHGNDALDDILGGARTYVEYSESDIATVTITSGKPMSKELLGERLGKVGSVGGAGEAGSPAIGSVTVVTSPDGTQYAGIALADATVVVMTTDSGAMKQALQMLKRAN